MSVDHKIHGRRFGGVPCVRNAVARSCVLLIGADEGSQDDLLQVEDGHLEKEGPDEGGTVGEHQVRNDVVGLHAYRKRNRNVSRSSSASPMY